MYDKVKDNKDKSKPNILSLMVEVNKMGDQEGRHGLLDDLLCQFLSGLGHHDIVEAFEREPKWYA